MPIQRLDDQLISQIAAGEVVERPASIVKELIENSLDAGAHHVSVHIEQGGLRRIGVHDDGVGISGDQLPLALARHATSKIDSLAALEASASLGFRGEALASVTSVADVELRSRVAGDAHGHAVSGANPGDVQPAVLEQGTRIEVRELFARVPARRKFMRTPATEFRHIQQAFNRLALSRVDVAFELHHDGRRLQQLPAATTIDDQRARNRRILGADFDAHAIQVDETISGLRLTGWIATPGFSRHRADAQYWYVNDRPVQDKLLAHAVRLAYRDMLHGQRYPAFILNLEIDRRTIDVNVHPAKSEIRLREPRLVHDFITRSVLRALERSDARPNSTRSVELPVASAPVMGGTETVVRHVPSTDSRMRPDMGAGALVRRATDAQYRFQMPQFAAVADSAADSTPATATDPTPLGYAIGQLHDIYIVAQNSHGLILVDMHAAHERVLYERLKAEHTGGRIASRRLLVPASLTLDAARVDTAEANREALNRVGFDFAPSAADRLRLTAVPALIAEVDYLTVFNDALAELQSGMRGVDRVRDVIDDLLADVGCKAAIKAGRRLTLVEMNALLADMSGTKRAGHCNHGRPSWVQVDRAGLDRLFMRGQ